MAEPAQNKQTEPRKARLRESQIGVAGFRNTTHQVDLTEGQTLDDALRPEFWASVCPQGTKRLREHDLIEVRHVQKLFFAQLYVLDVGDGWAKVVPVNAFPLVADVDVPDGSPLIVRWNVGTRGYEVQRRADKAVLSPKPFRLKADAVAWAKDHLAKLEVA